MIKNENIICISSIDWDFVWQGHQEIMSAFAGQGNRVLFIENTGVRAPGIRDMGRLKKRLLAWLKSTKGFRQEAKNLYVYSPLILPFPYSRIARQVNKYLLLGALRRWMKVMNFHDPIVWAFLPTGTTLDIERNIDKKLLVYYCIADFYELAGRPGKIKKTEDRLIEDSDIVFAQGKDLEQKCLARNNNVHIFQFGVNVEIFRGANVDLPPEMRRIKRPVIGYIGGLHRHVDFDLVSRAAKNMPDSSFVLIGPVQTDVSVVGSIKNIHLLGKKPFMKLPAYLKNFDVGVIPYADNEYTRTVFPTKLNEYHAMGIPVVSTDLPEVRAFNEANGGIVYIAERGEDFEKCIEQAIRQDCPGKKEKRIESAGRNDWKCRIEQMSILIERAISQKSFSATNWQKNFLNFYTFTRKRVLRTGLAVLAGYLLIFYTPLAWMIAGPLKMQDVPSKSRAIVVFAGGVGESGQAGEGYEERVAQAARLYREGYADKIVLVSGYTYVFKEPFVMKALALSLGIPESVILIEENATNTYEYVKAVNKLIVDKGWGRIILVSSPYNMLRSKLVFSKVSPLCSVDYCPAPRSIFFEKPKGLRQINLRQISAIIHEYIGIVYYLFKGYA